MIFKKIISIFKNYKQYEVNESKRVSLDMIISEINPEQTLEIRIEWIQELVKWIRSTELFELEPEKIPATKLKYLLMVLERNPEAKQKMKEALRDTLQELSYIDFFCEVGLPSQMSLIGELIEKITAQILPKKPIGNQLSELMMSLFSDKEDIYWLRSLDEATLVKLTELFTDDNENSIPHLKNDIEDALIYLISQIISIGLSSGIRKRIPHKRIKSLPFFYLSAKLNLYLKTKNDVAQKEFADQLLKELFELLKETELSITEVYLHLDRYGISTHLVFQLERMKLYLKRTVSLLEILDSGHLAKTKISNFIADLIEENLIQKNIMGMISTNATLLAQKIIENNSQTGEHYIAKDSKEYFVMFRSALGGGALTAFTVYIKYLLLTIKLTPFFYGAFSAVNYAGSFLLIQFSGFTLATKQPAATASALAQKLETMENRKEIESLIDEIVFLTRTQIAAVFGNLLSVIPMVLIINLIYHLISGNWIFSKEIALYNIRSTDIFGPSILFAIFTGFLLWLSSVFAGWAQNWYSFNQLNFLIINNKKIKTVLSAEGAKKLANFLDYRITGIVGNISLGFFLGLLPVLLEFIGIPLQVRHVTLSTGALAASIPVLGMDVLKSSDFIRACFGIILIGVFNISISFLLALTIAFRAKKISMHRKALVYGSVLKRFYEKPFSFFLP